MDAARSTLIAIVLPLAAGCGSAADAPREEAQPPRFIVCGAAAPIEPAAPLAALPPRVKIPRSGGAVAAPVRSPIVAIRPAAALSDRRGSDAQAAGDEPRSAPPPMAGIAAPPVSSLVGPAAASGSPAISELENPPTAVPAAWAGPRLREAEQLAAEADQHFARGFELANRGATFAARAEFHHALRAVAEGHDAATGTGVHTAALAAALTALEELEDFVPRGPRGGVAGSQALAAAGHRTPVLKDGAAEGLAAAGAQDAYVQFATAQLAAAVPGDPRGGRALYALGKVHSILAGSRSQAIIAADAKAAAYFQAALAVDPRNSMAANDLGVLLAEEGRTREARELLWHCAALAPQAATWHNLATVHARLGETRLAEQAWREARLASGGVPADGDAAALAWRSLRWLDPKTFAATSQPAADLQPAAGAAARAAAGPAAPPSRPSIARWLPWSRAEP